MMDMHANHPLDFSLLSLSYNARHTPASSLLPLYLNAASSIDHYLNHSQICYNLRLTSSMLLGTPFSHSIYSLGLTTAECADEAQDVPEDCWAEAVALRDQC
jgi:hypothetical protein